MSYALYYNTIPLGQMYKTWTPFPVQQLSVRYLHLRLFEQNKTTALEHLRRNSDFLELGDGVWYKIHEAVIEYLQ